MTLIGAAVSRTRTVVLALAFIIVAGLASYIGLPKEAEPDIEIPLIYISLALEGVSPEDAERLLIRPLEQELRVLEGVVEMEASAYQGGGNLQLEFEPGIDTQLALAEVREKVDAAKAELPDETEEPSVTEIKFNRFSPMLVMNVGGDIPERTLFALARDLKQRIETLPGVLEAELVGEREELLEVVIDPLAMESYGLSQNAVLEFVSRNNRLVAAGSLQSAQGSFPVKVPGVFESVEDVLRLPVKVEGERVVMFQDIASVRRTYKEATRFARLNGKRAIAVEVIQRGGANVIETIDQVKALVAREMESWPPGMELVISRDKSEEIEEMLTELQNNVLAAVLLVFIVIIGILGLRNAALVGVAIPGSFLAAFVLLGVLDMTINMMVLFSLIMAVGMLVDGAIVVVELADRRMAEGDDRRTAYKDAAKRMAWPIIASTATTLAAFAPLLFWPDMIGEFMSFLPLTLILVLSASLFMALIFVPTLGSLFGKPGDHSERMRRDLIAAESGDLDSIGGFTGRYLGFLKRALAHPWRVAGGVFGLLVLLYTAYPFLGNGVELFPEVEPEFAMVEVRARGDLSPLEQDALVREVEARVLGLEGVETVYARTGAGSQSGPSDQIGLIQLNFTDWETRDPARVILDRVRERSADLAGIHVDTRLPDAGPPTDKPVRIELAAEDARLLDEAALRVRAALETIPGVENVEDSRALPGIEWRIDVDRAEAAKYGVDITLVGNAIQLVTNGIKLGEYRPDDADEEIDIRVRYPYDERSLEQLDALRIPTAGGNVPISNFVTRRPAQKVATIDRTDMRRTVTISSDLGRNADGSRMQIAPVIAELENVLPSLGIDPSVDVSFRGGNEDENESIAFLGRAMLIALALILMILVTQFNSLFQALLILTAVVCSTGGVLLGLMVGQIPFGIIMSGIGAITLAGIVVNNNIVLIDTYNIVRREVGDAREAILRTCAQRLRPVLLTMVTTVLGLMPMTLGINVNLIDREVVVGGPTSQWWTQMAASVSGGLLFATLLTLLLTPSLLMIQANVSQRIAEKRAALLPGASETAG